MNSVIASFLRLAIAGTIACAALATADEAHATVCEVSNASDNPGNPGTNTLRWCVARTNAGIDSSIEITVSSAIYLNAQLHFTESTEVTGLTGALIRPGDDIGSMIQLGATCAPNCLGPAYVIFNNIEFDGWWSFDTRAVDITPGSGLEANGVRFVNFGSLGNGGAIRAGQVTTVGLFDCELESNGALNGGAIASNGDLVIHDTLFDGNLAGAAGGAVYMTPLGSLSKTLTVVDGVFNGNSATQGGAVYAIAGANGISASISISEFTDNTATDGGGYYGAGTIADSDFLDNDANKGGGLALVRNSTVTGSSLTSNHARQGAGLSFVGASASQALTLRDSTLESNALSAGASAVGGGIYVYKGSNHVVTNSTFYLNGATNGALPTSGGAIYLDSATVDLQHVTMVGNIANTGGGVVVKNGTFKPRSTVIAASTGGNCSLTASPVVQTTSLSSDNTCGALTYINTDPLLGAMGSWGGPTRVMVPASNSKLVNHGQCLQPKDQRLFTRPGTDCDIGSVER